jgi:hypothetical protein
MRESHLVVTYIAYKLTVVDGGAKVVRLDRVNLAEVKRQGSPLRVDLMAAHRIAFIGRQAHIMLPTSDRTSDRARWRKPEQRYGEIVHTIG